MNAIFQSLVPRLSLRNYKIGERIVNKFMATARTDNPASQKMLIAVGFQAGNIIEKYGAMRVFYEMDIKPLKYAHQHFFTLYDQQLRRQQYFQHIDDGADITAEEMACSSFGRRSPENNFNP
jgi:hypothetical protein